MEALAYTHMSVAYEEAEAGIKYNLSEVQLTWKKLPSSAWLCMVGCAILFGGLDLPTPTPASAASYRVTTSSSPLLVRNSRGRVVGRYSKGRVINVSGFSNGRARVGSNRYVSVAYISRVGSTGGSSIYGRGSRGSNISSIQRALKSQGYGVPVTGYYGSLTTSAVRRFQASSGLRQDGVVGPATRRALGLG